MTGTVVTPPPPATSRVRTWLERIGMTLLGIGAYVVWGLWDGLDLAGLIAIPLCLGALVGFLLLTLWLSEKVHGAVVALVYAIALAALGGVLWLTTGAAGMVAVAVVPSGVLGLIFLIGALAGGDGAKRRRSWP